MKILEKWDDGCCCAVKVMADSVGDVVVLHDPLL